MENEINKAVSPAIKKKKRSKRWFWVLGILLIIALGYISYGKYSDWRYDQDEEIYINGANFGYNSGIMQVVGEVNTCRAYPMSYINGTSNDTINLFKLECLSLSQTQCLLK